MQEPLKKSVFGQAFFVLGHVSGNRLELLHDIICIMSCQAYETGFDRTKLWPPYCGGRREKGGEPPVLAVPVHLRQ